MAGIVGVTGGANDEAAAADALDVDVDEDAEAGGAGGELIAVHVSMIRGRRRRR